MTNHYRNRFSAGALMLLFMAQITSASQNVRDSIKTVESSNPPYVANVAGGRVISIALSPQLLRLDMNPANSIRSETGTFKPARYRFPDANVPHSVLSRLADIYQFARRRDVPIVSSGGDWVIAEYFRANSHIPVSRFQLLGKQVQRQEQLDHSGKTVKLIVVGWEPWSAKDDDGASETPAVGMRPVWLRVFKTSPTGKKTLVALAWRKTSFAKAPDTYDAPGDDELVFGLPNGIAKWRTKADFFQAEHIDLAASSLDSTKRPAR